MGRALRELFLRSRCAARWSLTELYPRCGQPIVLRKKDVDDLWRETNEGSIPYIFLSAKMLKSTIRMKCLRASRRRTRLAGTKNDALAGLGYPGLGPPPFTMHRYSVYRPLPNPPIGIPFRIITRVAFVIIHKGGAAGLNRPLAAVRINF